MLLKIFGFILSALLVLSFVLLFFRGLAVDDIVFLFILLLIAILFFGFGSGGGGDE